jgi:hypothetical protein
MKLDRLGEIGEIVDEVLRRTPLIVFMIRRSRGILDSVARTKLLYPGYLSSSSFGREVATMCTTNPCLAPLGRA